MNINEAIRALRGAQIISCVGNIRRERLNMSIVYREKGEIKYVTISYPWPATDIFCLFSRYACR